MASLARSVVLLVISFIPVGCGPTEDQPRFEPGPGKSKIGNVPQDEAGRSLLHRNIETH